MGDIKSPQSTVLIIDDDANDRFLFSRAFIKAGLPHRLVAFDDSELALTYLKGSGNYTDRGTHPLPHLIFLDLKMPKISGFEILGWMHDSLPGRIPVVVLSSSSLRADVEQAQQLGAADYQVKPGSPDDLQTMVENACAKFLPKTSI